MRAASLLLVAALLLAAALSLPPAAAAQDLDFHLEEVRRLIEEKAYVTALEDLRFIAQQVQDLRLAEASPLFPEPPPGWTADRPLRTSAEDEIWSRRLQVQRRYVPERGSGRIECLFDFYSPLIPKASLSINPVMVAGDPRAEIVDLRGNRARLWFNADTGEGELLVVIGGRVLVSLTGKGIDSRDVLREFALRLDLPRLASWAPP